MTGRMKRGHTEQGKLLEEGGGGTGQSAGGHNPRRVFRDQFSDHNFSDDQCIRDLWFINEVVTEICQWLQPQLQPQNRAWTALPVAVKVTVALNFYGSGFIQAAAGDISNISWFAVHYSKRESTEAVYTMRKRFISFPFARDKQEEQAQGFARIAGLPMVQGAIDCMHITIRAPHRNSAIFLNRKGFHSLNVQVVCDHRQRIMQVNVRYLGSSHVSFILRQPSVPPTFQPAQQVKGWLLGDKGYLLMKWLMTLVRNAHMCAQQTYNECHAAARNNLEHTISVLKHCFCCMDRSGGAL
ncbi:putative nuclease HARBI1 [Heptranchias perlo]|uniref:putative nuclease HARBI1 n=1 Tax=Heptranchias perlo TaxID=212740 RepID=UPI003559B2D0